MRRPQIESTARPVPPTPSGLRREPREVKRAWLEMRSSQSECASVICAGAGRMLFRSGVTNLRVCRTSSVTTNSFPSCKDSRILARFSMRTDGRAVDRGGLEADRRNPHDLRFSAHTLHIAGDSAFSTTCVAWRPERLVLTRSFTLRVTSRPSSVRSIDLGQPVRPSRLPTLMYQRWVVRNGTPNNVSHHAKLFVR